MTLHMQQRLTRWDSFTTVDLQDIGAGDFVLSVSYSHAARLTWTCLEAQHTQPIPAGCFIRFWDDSATDPDGDPFDENNPMFIGYVEMPEPAAESIGVNYTAYDPTFRATREVTIFNAAWPAGTPPSVRPERPTGAVPRLVYNVRITADPDWSHQVGGDGTLGQVIAGVLEFTYHPLVWVDAAPGDGTIGGAVDPYDPADLAALTSTPQEKLDFASESPYSAIQRLMRYDPRFRCMFDPSTKLWRFRDITQAPTKTVIVNEGSSQFPPMTLSLRPSAENCITAITIFGPPAPFVQNLFWDDPVDAYAAGGVYAGYPRFDLTPLGSPTVYHEFSTAGGIFQTRFWKQFQITDPAYRRGARELPVTYEYQQNDQVFSSTSFPLLLVSYDHGATWQPWPTYFDELNGIVEFATPPVYQVTNDSGMSVIPASTQIWFAPNALRLIWAPHGEPLTVRKPATGYEGTAYTQMGLRYEDFQNDEALMVGREFGQPVTIPERRAAFETYAQTILDQRKDVVWTGAAQLDGLDWDYIRLNRKLQILAKDGSGNFLTTAWDNVGAYVTDVEFDFEEQTTSLTFSADKLALFGIDSAMLKERLKIRPLQQMVEYQTQFLYAMLPLPSGQIVNQVVGVQTTPVFHYMDNPSAVQQQRYQQYQQAMAGAESMSGGGGT